MITFDKQNVKVIQFTVCELMQCIKILLKIPFEI